MASDKEEFETGIREVDPEVAKAIKEYDQKLPTARASVSGMEMLDLHDDEVDSSGLTPRMRREKFLQAMKSAKPKRRRPDLPDAVMEKLELGFFRMNYGPNNLDQVLEMLHDAKLTVVPDFTRYAVGDEDVLAIFEKNGVILVPETVRAITAELQPLLEQLIRAGFELD
jgi:hypothetical protein